MEQLNKEAYTVGRDRLIYDASHPIDGTIIKVTLPGTEETKIERGQIIDHKDGVFSMHADSGVASVIAAETVIAEKGVTEIELEAYTSGTFRADATVSAVELTDADIQGLREKGIYLK